MLGKVAYMTCTQYITVYSYMYIHVNNIRDCEMLLEAEVPSTSHSCADTAEIGVVRPIALCSRMDKACSQCCILNRCAGTQGIRMD